MKPKYMHFLKNYLLFKLFFIGRLEVKDNGSGYDSSKKTDSLGLVLINTLSTRQLKGTIKIDSKNGTKVLINWTSKDE